MKKYIPIVIIFAVIIFTAYFVFRQDPKPTILDDGQQNFTTGPQIKDYPYAEKM